MRCFLAVWPPEDVRRKLAAATKTLRSPDDGVAWIPTDNLHVTLQFLGEVEEARALLLADAMAPVLAQHAAFTVTLGHPGLFPDLFRPRILFTALSVGAVELSALVAAVVAVSSSRGFVPEDRPFHPHLTLGRVKSERRSRDAVARFAASSLPPLSFDVSEVALVRSDRTASGSRYTTVRNIPMQLV